MTSFGIVTNEDFLFPASFSVSTRTKQYTATCIILPAVLPDPVTALAPFTLTAQESYTDLAPGATAAFGPGSTGAMFSTLYRGFDGIFYGTEQFGNDFSKLTFTSISGDGGLISFDIETFASAALTVEYA